MVMTNRNMFIWRGRSHHSIVAFSTAVTTGTATCVSRVNQVMPAMSGGLQCCTDDTHVPFLSLAVSEQTWMSMMLALQILSSLYISPMKTESLVHVIKLFIHLWNVYFCANKLFFPRKRSCGVRFDSLWTETTLFISSQHACNSLTLISLNQLYRWCMLPKRRSFFYHAHKLSQTNKR